MENTAANTIGYVLVSLILLIAVVLVASRFMSGSVLPGGEYSSSFGFPSASSVDGSGVGTQIDVEGGMADGY